MSQYDFGTIDPNTKSGTALATDLNSWRNALHSTHGGSSAPSYITAGMLWLDTTSANYKLKLYDGAQSIDVGIIDATNNVARVAVDSAATSYITATTAAQIKFVIASVDTATIRSTGLQFNIASPIIGDSSNNGLLSFTTTASAVNQINVANAATGTNPVISAIGNDTNIGITLTPKGTGRTNIGQLALDGTTITTTAAQLNFISDITSLVQAQLDAKAPLASPALTGTPTAPTASNGTNTTQLATTAFVLANAGGATVNIQVFTATGTYTPTAGYKWGIAFVTGGGGGVAGIGSTDADRASGGAGGTAIGLLNLTTLGAVTATVGAGGTAGGSSGTTGTNGTPAGSSTLSTLTGGAGNSSNQGTAGGTASGGIININGGDGEASNIINVDYVYGTGGASFWGGGAAGNASATVYGTGGGGRASTNSIVGTAGMSGVIMIMEFK